jgi:plasmid stability protein
MEKARSLPPGSKSALGSGAEVTRPSLEAEASEIRADALGCESATLPDLLGSEEGSDVAFEPERLGLIARTMEL